VTWIFLGDRPSARVCWSAFALKLLWKTRHCRVDLIRASNLKAAVLAFAEAGTGHSAVIEPRDRDTPRAGDGPRDGGTYSIHGL